VIWISFPMQGRPRWTLVSRPAKRTGVRKKSPYIPDAKSGRPGIACSCRREAAGLCPIQAGDDRVLDVERWALSVERCVRRPCFPTPALPGCPAPP
jgi:hypothetical protein